jgi:hypothetical protein
MAMSHVNNGPLGLIGDSVPKPLGFTAFAPEMAASWRCGAASAARAIPASESALRVAVGMLVARHPPHRSVRAALPHTALPLDSGVKANVRIGMKSAWTRNPPVKDRSKLFPIRLPPLTTAA